MYVPFDNLSDQSRVWIYASQTPFNPKQTAFISETLKPFTDDWQAHGTPLKASFTISHNQFIIIGVDESHHSPSGCSIDKSVQIIKNIESELGIDLMNRMVVYILKDKMVQTAMPEDLGILIAGHILTPDSQVFDNTITSCKNFRNSWIKTAKETWIQRYFKQENV
ncbi:MAG: hypothetical protein ACTHJT_05320 [Cytophaga sp.]|uniref:hypothetical protein n=1 Tax=Cytophaga sp. TaxID=29535 RepID=UPI003F807CD7